MENSVTQLKEKMRKGLEKESEQHRRQLQNTTVRFPTHTTNVNHSTFIQPSAVLISSESLLNFTSLEFISCILRAMILIYLHLNYQKLLYVKK